MVGPLLYLGLRDDDSAYEPAAPKSHQSHKTRANQHD
jgi:hypothetical protein